MDVSQPLLDLGYDPSMIASLFEVFKDTWKSPSKKALAIAHHYHRSRNGTKGKGQTQGG